MPNNFGHLNGTGQDDNLVGTIAWEIVHGRGGNDVIEGGGGLDYLHGDGGADTFVVRSDSNSDVIFDFDRTEGDRIMLDINGPVVFPSGPLFDGQTFVANGITFTVGIVDEPASGPLLDTRIVADMPGELDVFLTILGYPPDQLFSTDFVSA